MTLDSRIIVNLKVISKLNVGEKLSYTNGYFSISCDKSLSSKLFRWILGDSRSTTIDAIESLSTICLTHSQLSQSELDHLVRQLRSAITGITNLMMTYQEDSTVVSRLEFIIDRIRDFIEKFPTPEVEDINDTVLDELD